jgi:hypothetical protein
MVLMGRSTVWLPPSTLSRLRPSMTCALSCFPVKLVMLCSNPLAKLLVVLHHPSMLPLAALLTMGSRLPAHHHHCHHTHNLHISPHIHVPHPPITHHTCHLYPTHNRTCHHNISSLLHIPHTSRHSWLQTLTSSLTCRHLCANLHNISALHLPLQLVAHLSRISSAGLRAGVAKRVIVSLHLGRTVLCVRYVRRKDIQLVTVGGAMVMMMMRTLHLALPKVPRV